MAGHLDAKSSLISNQGDDRTRQPKSQISYGTVSFHFYHAFHLLSVIFLLTAPGESHHAFETHPGRYFTLAFMSSISIMFSGLRLLLHDILTENLLDIVSTIQDIVIAFCLVFYSATLVGGILFTEGLSAQNMSLLWPAVLLYSAISQHLLRLLLRFMPFTKWNPFAKWGPLDISGFARFLGTPGPKSPIEQTFYLYATTLSCISGIFIETTHVLVRSEEWADVRGNVQSYVGIEVFRRSRIFISFWCCVHLASGLFLPSPTSSFSPTSFYPASISLCFPRLRQPCSSLDLVASLLMFAFAAANSTYLFRMEPILLSRGHTSWIQAAFWARQLTIVAVTFFTGAMFLVIRRQRSLVHSMTTVEKIRRTIADNINGPKGLEFLVMKEPEWTDDEIVSLLKLRGLTERGRENVATFLYHEREMAEILEKNNGVLDPEWSRSHFKRPGEEICNFLSENRSPPPPYSPEGSDLELGLGESS